MAVSSTKDWTRLDCRADERWQGGFFRMPMWVEGPDGRPFRPWVLAWVSLRTGLVTISRPMPRQDLRPEMAAESLRAFAIGGGTAGYLPGTLLINDPSLTGLFAELLASTPVRVLEAEGEIPEPIAGWLTKHAAEDPLPGILEGGDVTPRELRDFAEIARKFFEAQPWRVLTDMDLFEIVEPKSVIEPAFVLVMGAAGIDHGLFFFSSRESLDLLRQGGLPALLAGGENHWLLSFSTPQELPLSDADLFEDLALPVAAEGAHPVLLAFDDGHQIRRPTARELRRAGAVMAAFAHASDDQLASGEISCLVDGTRCLLVR